MCSPHSRRYYIPVIVAPSAMVIQISSDGAVLGGSMWMYCILGAESSDVGFTIVTKKILWWWMNMSTQIEMLALNGREEK
jgi:hypothetical protein